MIYIAGLFFIIAWAALASYGFNDDDFRDK